MPLATFNLPNKTRVEFQYESKMHLPKFVEQFGLKNYEPVSIGATLAYVEQTPGSFFDIGANIGLYSLLVSTALRRHVKAAEPFKEAADILRLFASKLQLPIDVLEIALSDEIGFEKFYISAKSDMSNSLNSEFRAHREVRVVPCSTIDQFSKTSRPSFLKIDTETTELDVLHGAQATLRRDRPAILIEVISDELSEQIGRMLKELNYEIVPMETLRKSVPNWQEYQTDGDERNWFCVPKEMQLTDKFYARLTEWVLYIRKISS